jgi:hypothetical protein
MTISDANMPPCLQPGINISILANEGREFRISIPVSRVLEVFGDLEIE